MVAALDLVGNPSSVHAEGRRLLGVIETARGAVATLVGSDAAHVVFTSGATEANAWVMAGGWRTIFVSSVEHDSVLGPARASGARLVLLPVDANGVIDVVRAEALIGANAGRAGSQLLSVQLANNETGVLQPVAALAAVARQHGVLVHCDAVQACGRVPVDMATLGADFLALSGHKLGGPKGVGALVFAARATLKPLIGGGGQERRRRGGTEGVAGIAGFGTAAALAGDDLASIARVRALRDQLERGVKQASPDAVIIGSGAERLANTSCIALAGTTAETLVIKFDLKGIAISAGAACSSGKVSVSHVLTAIGIAEDLARAAVRISIGATTTAADVDAFLAVWREVATRKTVRAA
jgi:cysteine desulfurase